MACYVCSGAALRCSMGSKESELAATYQVELAVVGEKPIATAADHKPLINIRPFGHCKSPANPAVADAPATANGTLQMMPCVPNTTSPWMGRMADIDILGQQALLNSSKLLCEWNGMIEITDPGQDIITEDDRPSKPQSRPVKSKKKAEDLAVATGNVSKPKNGDGLTVKDFAEILTRIEKKQKCYESARHYAAYHLDYLKLTNLARRYVDETDTENKEKEKDNDPNLMPSRFMLLYGADDGKLREHGHLDSHHDDFADPSEHEVSVANLRKALILLGHDIAGTGPFDEPLLFAILRYLDRFDCIELKHLCADETDADKPLDVVARKYGIATWKFFEKEKNRIGNVDHEEIMKKLNADYGDELIREKGGNPHDYISNICYHYPWVPFSMAVEMDEDYQEKEDATYEIYNRESSMFLGKGPFRKQNNIESLLPDSESLRVFVDGLEITIVPKLAVINPSQKSDDKEDTEPKIEK